MKVLGRKKHQEFVTVVVFKAEIARLQEQIDALRADAREDRQSIAALAYNDLKQSTLLEHKKD